jgi:hypothetical protein
MPPAAIEKTQSDPGPRPELVWLPVDHLWVDSSYQRAIDGERSQRLIAAIAVNFRWSSFQAILAVKHGDGWRIIDGQHRVAAARQRGIPDVPAVVVANLSVAEQAAAFVEANRGRIPINPFALYRARLAAEDTVAVAIAAICAGAAISIAPYAGSKDYAKPGQTLALGTIGVLVRRYGADQAAMAVEAVAAPYHDIVGALRAPFFDGAGRFIAAWVSARHVDRVSAPQSPAKSLASAGKPPAPVPVGGRDGRPAPAPRPDVPPPGARPTAKLVKVEPPAKGKPGPKAAAERVHMPHPPHVATAQSMGEMSACARFERLVRGGAGTKMLAVTFGITEADAREQARIVERGGKAMIVATRAAAE